MMDKNSAEGKTCVYCSNPALPETNPPVCADHLMIAKEATQEPDDKTSEPKTLKELENSD